MLALSKGYLMVREEGLVFPGQQGPLIGILTMPAEPRAAVLIVVGQPQSRHGSHRMFTRLCRSLATEDVASLRFDCGGWGDSPGTPLAFEQSAHDITLAAQALVTALPAGVPLVLVGLCDGASAAVIALPRLKQVAFEPAALCMINPWVRSDATLNDALVKTWYARRVVDPAFWRQLFSGQLSMTSIQGFAATLYAQARSRFFRLLRIHRADSADKESAATSLPELLLEQLKGFRGQTWTVLSGRDLTAGELESLMQSDSRWMRMLNKPGVILRIPGADHTFSAPDDWQRVAQWLVHQAHSLAPAATLKAKGPR